MLGDPVRPGPDARFFEARVAGWDRVGSRPTRGGRQAVTEVVATAATLAFNDAQTTGNLTH